MHAVASCGHGRLLPTFHHWRFTGAVGELADALEELRTALLADPYFNGVSQCVRNGVRPRWPFTQKTMYPRCGVRVFRLLLAHDMKFFAVVRRMEAGAHLCPATGTSATATGITQNELYDSTVARFSGTDCTLPMNAISCSRGAATRIAHVRFATCWSRAKRDSSRNGIAKWSQRCASPPARRSTRYACAGGGLWLWALQRFGERAKTVSCS